MLQVLQVLVLPEQELPEQELQEQQVVLVRLLQQEQNHRHQEQLLLAD